MKTLKRIVNVLLTKNCSQDEIAKAAGVSQMTISRWKDKSPDRVDLKALNKLEKYMEKMK